MFKVGITGGIGSGKTLVCRIFEILSVPVYYADYHAKRLMDADPDVREQLRKQFGPSVIGSGKTDRQQIARIVFNDQNALRALNAIIHPAVRKDFDIWIRNITGCDYVIEEAAILFESGAYKLMDFNISVSAPENMRIKRVMNRDHVARELVESRLRNQMSEEERNRIADEIIINDESELIIPQVIRLHHKILEKIQKKIKW